MTCDHAALSHTYDTTARANVGRCLSPGCSCGGLPGARAWIGESA